MLHREAAAKVGRLRAVTVERGATPAEAATAASLAQRLLSQITRCGDADTAAHVTQSALAPGVHVTVV